MTAPSRGTRLYRFDYTDCHGIAELAPREPSRYLRFPDALLRDQPCGLSVRFVARGRRLPKYRTLSRACMRLPRTRTPSATSSDRLSPSWPPYTTSRPPAAITRWQGTSGPGAAPSLMLPTQPVRHRASQRPLRRRRRWPRARPGSAGRPRGPALGMWSSDHRGFFPGLIPAIAHRLTNRRCEHRESAASAPFPACRALVVHLRPFSRGRMLQGKTRGGGSPCSRLSPAPGIRYTADSPCVRSTSS